MVRTALVLLLVVSAWGRADATPEEGLDQRASILAAEMRRDAAALHPFLRLEPGSALRRQAIRALGRIGDDGTGPGILRDVLSAPQQGDTDLDLWIWAAGIARVEELATPLRAQLAAHLAAGRADLAAAAARALGWTGAKDLESTLVGLLAHASPAVREGALTGLARARAGGRQALEAAAASIHDPDAAVRAAADHACWLIASGWSRAQRKEDETWDGDEGLARRFLPHLAEIDPVRRMGGIRVLAALLPKALKRTEAYVPVFALIDDTDPRVVQDAVSRIFGRREGEDVHAALVQALYHGDAKVRQLAAEALSGEDGPSVAQREALEARFAVESDARVREVLAVQLLTGPGAGTVLERLRARGDRPADPVLVQQTEATALLASKDAGDLETLLRWADPGASQRVSLHAATWLHILGGLEGREHPKLDAWLSGFFHGAYGVSRDDRRTVVAAAVSLVEANKRHGLIEALKGLWADACEDEADAELRAALVKAFGTLAADAACRAQDRTLLLAIIRHSLTEDASPWVRAAAREAARANELADVPERDEQQPNDWRGVPRAEDPVTGIDPPGDGPWLDEKAILQIADWIAAHEPLVVLETTAGTITLLLDPEAAPVHCVSLFNAVRNGVYTDTRWHRVVPNFVIQGGDPHGHGAGDGGWTVPDEISPRPYVRGALGMPKSQKDDGGCQLFIMHSAYHPLDERYTCYGQVVRGMSAVDAIRVGDRITRARILFRNP